MLNLQELMGKKTKNVTQKRSTHFNMKKLREVHDKAMNDAKYNGTTETIEEIFKLSQTLKEKM